MGLFSSKIEEEFVVVLDIFSGGVSGVVVLKNRKKLPLVLATNTKTFRTREKISPDRFYREMIEAIDGVCLALQSKTKIIPAKIYCILSVPWSHGEIKSVHVVRDKEFYFTDTFAEKIMNEEISKFQKNNSKHSKIIDKKITKISLNGYTVKSPHGQKTKSVEIDFFLSVSPNAVVEAIQDKINKTFKSKILFTSQMLSDYIFVRNFLPTTKEFAVLNVGAEVSEVLISKNEFLVGTAFFPFGTKSILRKISEILNKTEGETESLLRLHVSGLLDEDISVDFKKALNVALDMWQSELKQIFLDILPNRHIPHQIFLLTDRVTSVCLGERFNFRFFPEFTAGSMDFDVIINDTNTLRDFYNKTEYVTPDLNILIKAIYINQI